MFLKVRLKENEESEHDGSNGGVNGQRTLDTFVNFGKSPSVLSENSKVYNSSEAPYNGAMWMAFESDYMRHTIWKNSTFDNGTEKRNCELLSKHKKVKSGVTQKYKKCSTKKTPISKKKVGKRTSLTKRKVSGKRKKVSQRNKRRR